MRAYWQNNFCKDHPNIKPIEQQLEKKLTEIMKFVTIGMLLKHEKSEIRNMKRVCSIKDNECQSAMWISQGH